MHPSVFTVSLTGWRESATGNDGCNEIFYEAEDEVPETQRYPAGPFANMEKAFWKTKKGQMDIDDVVF